MNPSSPNNPNETMPMGVTSSEAPPPAPSPVASTTTTPSPQPSQFGQVPSTSPEMTPPPSVSNDPPAYEQGTPTITTSGSGGSKKILIIAGVVLLLIVLGVGGYLLAKTFLSPAPEVSPSPTPVAEEITAMCVNIKAYDEEWNRLTIEDLPALQPGDTVRFSAAGDTSSGTFDKARFSVNAVSLGETSEIRPGTDEFYTEYIIPETIDSFSVEAQLHHSTLDQWI
jgi:hypothetical protein